MGCHFIKRQILSELYGKQNNITSVFQPSVPATEEEIKQAEENMQAYLDSQN